ncbi:MAG: DUF6056 family protein [Lachnospiraceae bacterium]
MKRLEKYGTSLCFLLFFAFLLAQYWNVFLYHDDYGYLSLSYGFTADVAGHHFTLKQLFGFMKEHYYAANGRLLYTGLYLLLFWAGGLRLVQTAMAFIVLLDVYLVYWTVCRLYEVQERPMNRSERSLLAIFLCLLFGTIGLQIQKQGSYWFSASFTYLTPCIPFLFLMNFYFDTGKAASEQPGFRRTLCLCLLAFLSGFSQEQWIVATFTGICAIFLMKKILRQKWRFYDFAIFLSAIAGSMVIFLSPAVSSRFQSNANPDFLQSSLLENWMRNYRIILDLFFGGNNILYSRLLLFCIFLLALWMFLKKQKYLWLDTITMAATAAMMAWAPTVSHFRYTILTLYLILACIEIGRFFQKRNLILPGILFLCALSSLACMVMVPELPHRLLMQFILLSFVLMGTIVSCWIKEQNPALTAVILLFTAVISLPNMKQIYQGYHANYQVQMDNEQTVKQAVACHRSGTEETVALQIQPDLNYGGEMPYQSQYTYIDYWFRQYYDVPDEMFFEYPQWVE